MNELFSDGMMAILKDDQSRRIYADMTQLERLIIIYLVNEQEFCRKALELIVTAYPNLLPKNSNSLSRDEILKLVLQALLGSLFNVLLGG